LLQHHLSEMHCSRPIEPYIVCRSKVIKKGSELSHYGKYTVLIWILLVMANPNGLSKLHFRNFELIACNTITV